MTRFNWSHTFEFKMAKTTQIAVRVPHEVVEQADRIVGRLANGAVPYLEPTRTAVMRAAMMRGLDLMDEELAPKP